MTSMSDRNFIDTNVLVYAYDSADPAKQEQARQIMRSGITEETAVLSAQVFGEFFTVVTSRIPVPRLKDKRQAGLLTSHRLLTSHAY